MINLINEIRRKLDELEARLNNDTKQHQEYVDLSNGSEIEKLERICSHVERLQLNMIPTPKDSQIVRSAIVSTIGDKGLNLWLRIRKFRDNYDENQQMSSFLYLLSRKDSIPLNFGCIVNRYKAAINKYNESIQNNYEQH